MSKSFARKCRKRKRLTVMDIMKEYLDEYFGTPYFSVRKFFRLCDKEKRKFRRNY